MKGTKAIINMAKINLSKAHTASYDGFEGIDSTDILSGKGGIKSLTDLWIRPDGALERRDGFSPFTELPGEPRAVFQISEDTVLALIGCFVYSLDLSSHTCKQLSMVGTGQGEGSFFSFNGSVYLLDGAQLYYYNNGYFLKAEGYVPLYGKDWHPTKGGEVYEPLNMLSSRMRVSYKLDQSGIRTFILPVKSDSLDAVTVNGKEAVINDYHLTDDYVTIISDVENEEGDVVTFYVTIGDVAAGRHVLTVCKEASAYGDGSLGNERVSVAFFKGDDPNLIYPSSPIDEEEFEESKKVYGNLTRLYVMRSGYIHVNDGSGSVLDVCQKDDGLMVFTADRAFMLRTFSDGRSTLVRVSLGTGCSSPRGATISDDTPITVSYYGIFKWDPVSYEEGEYRASCISQPIRELLNPSFFTSATAHHYRKRGELWFSDPSDSGGKVFIYSIDRDAWFCFSGIHADHFLEHNGEPGFIEGKTVYFFASDAVGDLTDDGERAVCSRLESGMISFGGPNERKKLSRCLIRTSPSATVTLTVTDAEGNSSRLELTDGSGERLGYIEKRLKCKRSRHFSFTLEAEGKAVIYGITLIATD